MANLPSWGGVPYLKYSTSETVCGEWIDGKPLYTMTVSCGALPKQTTKTVSVTIPNLGDVIELFGWAKKSDGTYISLPFAHPNGSSSLQITFKNGTLSLFTNGDLSVYNTSYMTFRYTKSTD